MPEFTPTIHVKAACPFCLKLRVALTELGIAERFRFVIADADEATLEATRARIAASGLKPGFPALESAPGVFATESDELIARYCAEQGKDPQDLALLAYYKAGVFPRFIELFKEHLARGNA